MEKVLYDIMKCDDGVTRAVPVVNGIPQDPSYVSWNCLLYTSPSPRDLSTSRMPSSA